MPLLIVRKGIGALHIARAYGDKYITRCGKEYYSEEIGNNVWRSKKMVEAIWKAWSKKCGKCRAGLM